MTSRAQILRDFPAVKPHWSRVVPWGVWREQGCVQWMSKGVNVCFIEIDGGRYVVQRILADSVASTWLRWTTRHCRQCICELPPFDFKVHKARTWLCVSEKISRYRLAVYTLEYVQGNVLNCTRYSWPIFRTINRKIPNTLTQQEGVDEFRDINSPHKKAANMTVL